MSNFKYIANWKLQIGNCKFQSAFTLIELLIVIAIIGILVTTGIFSWQSAQAKARDNKRITDLKSIQTALETYKNAKGRYPQGPAPNLGMGAAGELDGDLDGAVDCGGADPADPFIPALDSSYMAKTPRDNVIYNGAGSGGGFIPPSCSYLYFGYPAQPPPPGYSYPNWGCNYEFYILAAYMELPQPAANKNIPSCYNYASYWADPHWYILTPP